MNAAVNGQQDAVLVLKGVSKKIGSHMIVDKLSFDLRPGEIVGLLGPNGAGKTTTIRMMVGLIGMTEGDVLIKGHSVKHDFVHAIRHVGGIIENPEFYPYMTGLDNLKQYMRMSEGISMERIQEVVKLVGLEGALNKRVKAYSLGMRQRLGIAQALLHKPSVLILDEPTNGLDPAGIHEMREYLKNIAANEGLSILVSSHLLSEIEQMCNRIVVIQNGKLVTVRSLGEERSVEEHIRVVIRVDSLAQARKVIEDVDGVQVTGVQEDRRELALTLLNEDIPGVVNALAAQGIKLYRIEEIKQSLEEEFLKLTGGNQIA